LSKQQIDWYSAPIPVVLGHRGASAYAPENTLAAFELALQQGAAGFEFDVQRSADGHLVLIHDLQLDRTTNGNGRVGQHTLAELQALDAGNGHRIPTLNELFTKFGRHVLYNLEIKGFSLWNDAIETAVAAAIEQHGLERHVLVSSFNPISVWRVQRYLKTDTITAVIRDENITRFAHHLVPTPADHPRHTMITAATMAQAKARNLRVNTWTVNDPAQAVRLAGLGVQGLISNNPDTILAALT